MGVLRGVLFVAVACGCAPASGPPVPDARLRAFTAERWAEWQPRKEERRFDEIGWAGSLREAKALAAKHRRPVFVFLHDGRINTGRC
jgi:hypothetical protein